MLFAITKIIVLPEVFKMTEAIQWPVFFESIIAFLKQPEIFAVFLTAGLTVVKYIIQPKSIVVWGISHGFAHAIPQQTGPVLLLYTRSILVRNAGRASAKDVEFYFNFKPEHFQIWPVIQFTSELTADGRFLVKIPFIRQNESFGIEVIQTQVAPPNLLTVRSMEGECKEVNMAPMQVFPNWFNILFAALMVLGIYQLLVWLIRIFQ